MHELSVISSVRSTFIKKTKPSIVLKGFFQMFSRICPLAWWMIFMSGARTSLSELMKSKRWMNIYCEFIENSQGLDMTYYGCVDELSAFLRTDVDEQSNLEESYCEHRRGFCSGCPQLRFQATPSWIFATLSLFLIFFSWNSLIF